MCGRYVIARTPGQLALPFDARVDESVAELAEPNWNVAPTHTVPVVLERLDDEGRVLTEVHAARWGLVPSWAREISVGSRMFNARSETVTEKPSFRAAVSARRCAIPADGYYEWKAPQTGRGKKQPYFVHPRDDSPIWFAGIYEWWRIPDDAQDPAGAHQTRPGRNAQGGASPAQWLLSCSILTREAPAASDGDPHLAALGALHNRLPMGMGEDFARAWIAPDDDKDRTRTLVERAVQHSLEVAADWRMHPVSADVGSVRSQGAHLVEPQQTLL
ncbi:SOS response-associated peptidase [Kocuria tytonis]|uniref:Abasic site processing protein n=1 Tax=Kocuria tytonis TaxID=2054280 RepID=A0A495AA69_9MICC|nr:SOS response-associated peptidase [Kocuria tytonis]RKQ36304.1 SOS response-associated peptidase [Kocuria tytonis]